MPVQVPTGRDFQILPGSFSKTIKAAVKSGKKKKSSFRLARDLKPSFKRTSIGFMRRDVCVEKRKPQGMETAWDSRARDSVNWSCFGPPEAAGQEPGWRNATAASRHWFTTTY
ncbi:MAG: hypothetical protein C4576_28010 [Desulfobacteraceae bacterium]|nr:MAG: hypothetical protein C4576_28010 [Desulfobacteraceae bacterium]